MQPPVPLDDLEIVGYATVLKETMRPSVVPPVFRLKEHPDTAFVPPYLFNAGSLCNSTALPASELQTLAERRQITLFAGAPVAAGRDYELWVGLDGQVRYEPRVQADTKLLALSKEHIAKAEHALREGQLAEAERCSSVALYADDRLVEPLAIKAALCRLKKDPTGERLMAKLAARKMTEDVFKWLVEGYCSMFGTAGPAAAEQDQPLPEIRCVRVMCGIAERRAP